MNIEVNVSPEQINKAVADAIIESAIGKELDRVIKQEVEKLGRSYNNPIEIAVQREIQNKVVDVVRENYSDFIKAKVTEAVTEKFTEDLFLKLWNSFESRH